MEVFMNILKRFRYFHFSLPSFKLYRIAILYRNGLHGFFLTATVIMLIAASMPSTASAQNDFDSRYDQAYLLFRQGKYDEALITFKKANRIKQDASLECLWGIAQTYSKLGAYQNAVKTCDRLIQLSDDNLYYRVKAWNLRGNELSRAATQNPEKLDESKLEEAETAYREVLKLSGSNVAHYSLGITLIRLNRIPEGIEELQIYVRSAEEEDLAEKARKMIQEPRRAVENFAPDFSFVTSDGEYLTSDDLKGNVLLLDFWGAWCQPCQNAVPFLSGLAKKYRKDPFILISIDENDEESKWREFIVQKKMDWTHTRDGDRKMQRLFQITGFPTYILVDHEGIIRYRGMGSGWQTEDNVSDSIKKALKVRAKYEKQQKDHGESAVEKLASLSRSETDTYDSRTPPPDILTARINAPVVNADRTYSFKIPRPSLEITHAENRNMSSELQSRLGYYRLRIRNWASLPDELFSTSNKLMSCSTGAVGSTMNTEQKRLEVIVKNEQGKILRSFCNMPQPQTLDNLLLIIPNQSRQGKIYLTLKDRLTGNMVQSDLVALP